MARPLKVTAAVKAVMIERFYLGLKPSVVAFEFGVSERTAAKVKAEIKRAGGPQTTPASDTPTDAGSSSTRQDTRSGDSEAMEEAI